MRTVQRSRLGALIMLFALVFGLIPAAVVHAQEDEPVDGDPVTEVLRKATDAGVRAFVYSGDDNAQPVALTFVVAEFDTEEQAEEAQELIPTAIERVMLGESAETTPEADFTVAAEYDVVDGGAAYHYQYQETEGFLASTAVSFVQIRDGTNLHLWIGFSFSMDAEIEPASPLDIFDPLVDEWFDDGSRAEDDILDRVPTVDDLPEGYELEDELQGIDALTEEEIEDDEA